MCVYFNYLITFFLLLDSCVFLIFEYMCVCTHACVCACVKKRNVIYCAVWTKPTRSPPTKDGKKRFSLTQQCLWQLHLCFCHFCFIYKHSSEVYIYKHQHENLGAQKQQSFQYLTHSWLLILLVYYLAKATHSTLSVSDLTTPLWEKNTWISYYLNNKCWESKAVRAIWWLLSRVKSSRLWAMLPFTEPLQISHHAL